MTTRMPPAFLLPGTIVTDIVTDGTVVEDAVVAVSGERITYAGPRTGFDTRSLPGLEEVGLPPGTLLLPGLVDLHCHGRQAGTSPAGSYRQPAPRWTSSTPAAPPHSWRAW